MQPYLPAEVFDRKKRGFGCPVGRWFRADLRELLRDTLAPGTLRRDGLFDPDVVAAVIDDHEQRREDRSETLLALLTFHIWRDQLREAGTLAPAGLAAGASR